MLQALCHNMLCMAPKYCAACPGYTPPFIWPGGGPVNYPPPLCRTAFLFSAAACSGSNFWDIKGFVFFSLGADAFLGAHRLCQRADFTNDLLHFTCYQRITCISGGTISPKHQA